MKITTILVIIVILAATVIGGLYYYTRSLKEDSYTSEYNFELSIETTDVQEGLIIYVPLPMKNGSPIVSESTFLQEANIPEGWTCEYVDTENGTMLKVEFQRLEVDHRYDDISLRVISENSINTEDALEDEPILSPRSNLREEEYTDEPYPERFEDRLEYYKYDTNIYVENITEGSEINIYLHHMGTNEWWVFGWSGNEYRNRLFSSAISSDGWSEHTADLIQGWGNY
ncbi:MAG: hypothetical protein ACOCT7_01060 [Candidatus Saliniplasma sp.]